MFSQYHQIAALLATFITIVAFLPQVYKTVKTKSGKTLSPTAFSLSYFGSVVLSVFASIHAPFVWTTLIVDLSIVWLVMPIFWYIAKDHNRWPSPKKTMLILFAINSALTVVFALSRVGIVGTELSPVAEFVMATVGFALTGFAFFPQTVQIIRARDLGDFSLLLAISYGTAQALNVVFWSGRIVLDHTTYLDWLPGIALAGVSVVIQAVTVTAVSVYRYQGRKARNAAPPAQGL